MPATTIFFADFVAALPAERRATVEKVWNTVRQAMPAGYTESGSAAMLQFMAGKEMAVGLASRKNHISLYLQTLYHFPGLGTILKTAAPKLKIGKSCINFNQAAELPLDALRELLQRVPADTFLTQVEAVRQNPAAAHQ